jgi:uncharacterized protein YeaO (DUF488 family)
MPFTIKRVYDAASADDGIRVLVDRLWPRGMTKVRARIDHWMKDIAPSPGLRTWFGHRPERFEEFGRRYVNELADNPLVAELRELGKGQPVTLVYGARDPEINHARVLVSVLKGKASRPRPKKKVTASGGTRRPRRRGSASKTSMPGSREKLRSRV